MAITEETTMQEEATENDGHDPKHAPAHADRSDSEQPCNDQPLALRIEALLLATDRPLTESRLADLLGLAGKGVQSEVRDAIDALNEQYESTGRSFRVERLAGGYQIMTQQAFGPLLARFHTDRQQTRLSQAALETLAIIAYRQPIMRAEIEAIRGVACGEVLRGLLERRLITIAGRAEELGRPMLYGTTREFLKVFGLAGLDDLPAVEGLEAGAARQTQPRSTAASGESGAQSEKSSDGSSSDSADDDVSESDEHRPSSEAQHTPNESMEPKSKDD